MVAELLLVFHDPKIVIVTCAEQTIRENLIVSAATGHYPNRPSARRELILPDFSCLDQTEGLLEPLLEGAR